MAHRASLEAQRVQRLPAPAIHYFLYFLYSLAAIAVVHIRPQPRP